MIRTIALAFTAAATISVAAPVSAATLLTSAAGYTGPGLDLSAFNAFYTFTAGPVSLPGGITYSSTTSNSVIGFGGYALNDNGSLPNALIVGTNDEIATVSFSFATPVSQFGGLMNYALRGTPVGNNPVISAFDSADNLIGSFDLYALARINTPGGVDQFAFRGIDGDGTGISRFTMSGAFIVIAGGTNAVVPEPASWAMLIAGFGLIGATMRRRRSFSATA